MEWVFSQQKQKTCNKRHKKSPPNVVPGTSVRCVTGSKPGIGSNQTQKLEHEKALSIY